MPKTESNAVALGTKAPDFSLPGPGGREVALVDYADRPALLVAFISNRCPFVVLLREEFAAFAREYVAKGLAVIAINANDADAHPEESLDRIEAEVRDQGYEFPYLKDAAQEVAKAYDAACTPDFFLFDAERRLAYHGQFDDARPGNGRPVSGADLRAAVNAVLAGEAPAARQTPSIGCNIKWSEGNAPAAASQAA